MKYFVVGMIVGLAIILLGEHGAFSALFGPGGALAPGASAGAGNGGALAPGASAGAGNGSGSSGSGSSANGGCGCGGGANPISVPAPAIPVNETPSSPWSAGFGAAGGNPNYEALQILPASAPITNASTQAY